MINGKHITATVLMLAFAAIALSAFASPAQFWLSASGTTTGPGAPTIQATPGLISYLYIWGRPGTDPMTGTLGKLQNVSLSLVATNAGGGIDFVDGTYTMYNPTAPNP